MCITYVLFGHAVICLRSQVFVNLVGLFNIFIIIHYGIIQGVKNYPPVQMYRVVNNCFLQARTMLHIMHGVVQAMLRVVSAIINQKGRLKIIFGNKIIEILLLRGFRLKIILIYSMYFYLNRILRRPQNFFVCFF